MLMASGTAEEFEVASSGAAAQPASSSAVAEAAKRRGERISKRDAVEHEKHRMKGHFPYDLTCVQCQQSRGVHRHPRQRQKPLEPAFLLISLTLRMKINARSTRFWRL